MIVNVLAAALLMGPAIPAAPQPPIQAQYGVPSHPPPCGHGWDLSAVDGLCYPNGTLPPQEQSARVGGYYHRGGGHYRGDGYYREEGGYSRHGRYPVPCRGHGVDRDMRDGRCYPTGTVPRRFQDRPENHYRY